MVIPVLKDWGMDCKVELEVTAFQQKAGDEDAKMEVMLDRENLGVIDVHSTKPETYKVTFDIKKGEHRLTLSFINDYYLPGDRNLFITAVSVGQLTR